jgi:uncharacterized membrane protein
MGYSSIMPILIVLAVLVVVIFLGTRMIRTWRGAGRG